MSNLPDRHNAPRWPIRETPSDIVMAALIIGMLIGLCVAVAVASFAIGLNGGHLCFSHDGISCNR
jgi:hypothetical protein